MSAAAIAPGARRSICVLGTHVNGTVILVSGTGKEISLRLDWRGEVVTVDWSDIKAERPAGWVAAS